ncbi:MAG TPA: hypothetical protein VIB82_09345 [Caulobacteraceae bacterium]|jgi:tetratricopeptide (TPR) repeat protein
MKYALLAACAAVTLGAAAAHADPLSDAKDGLAALNKGDNPSAVRLLTAALASGRLTRADSELAYVKRAEAFLAMEDATRALGDSNRALDLDPRDAEAAAARDRAQAVLAAPPARAVAVAPVQPAGETADQTIAKYNAAVAKYEAEKKAAADTYAQELAAHDAAAKAAEDRHTAELAAWTAHVAACQANAAKCGADSSPTQTAAPLAPTPTAGPRSPVDAVAGDAPKKPVEQVAAKAAPQPVKKPAAKHYDDDNAPRPTFF